MNELSLVEQARKQRANARLEKLKKSVEIARHPQTDFEQIKNELCADFAMADKINCLVSGGFINFNCTKYYSGGLKKLDEETVQVIEHKTGILGAFYQGQFVSLVHVVGF